MKLPYDLFNVLVFHSDEALLLFFPSASSKSLLPPAERLQEANKSHLSL